MSLKESQIMTKKKLFKKTLPGQFSKNEIWRVD